MDEEYCKHRILAICVEAEPDKKKKHKTIKIYKEFG